MIFRRTTLVSRGPGWNRWCVKVKAHHDHGQKRHHFHRRRDEFADCYRSQNLPSAKAGIKMGRGIISDNGYVTAFRTQQGEKNIIEWWYHFNPCFNLFSLPRHLQRTHRPQIQRPQLLPSTRGLRQTTTQWATTAVLSRAMLLTMRLLMTQYTNGLRWEQFKVKVALANRSH